jgi:xanthine dehydrogenase accessory factor
VTEPIDALRRLASTGRRGVHVIPLEGGDPSVLDGNGMLLTGDSLPREVQESVPTVLEQGVPHVVEADGGSWFVEPVMPPPRLLVFGAIAVADALVPMAAAAGFVVEVIDPRPWLATATRHPAAAAVHCGDPAEVIPGLDTDDGTVIVSFLHEPHLEDPVLQWALEGPAGYVGSMGSGRTTAAKRARLVEAGVEESVVERLHAPIGLQIGSVTPQEIAIAVLAEIVAVRRNAG